MKTQIFFLFFILTICLAKPLKPAKFQPSDISPNKEELQDLFSAFLLKFPNTDDTPERFQIFCDNYNSILLHNSNPSSTYTQGINQFTAMTAAELIGTYIMEYQNCSATTRSPKSTLTNNANPTYFDWRKMGIVTPVKNQGNCGSCWTFSTTGALESFWALYTGLSPNSLSEQQLLDCAGNFGNNACNGGLPSSAFQYIQWQGGLESELTYPYMAKQGSCQFKSQLVSAQAPSGSVNITEGDEDSMYNDLPNVGPISVCFEVVSGFQQYTGGVYSSTVCRNSTQSVNHAVLATGYGVAEDGTPYWIIKNSWGASWGLGGYFYMERGQNMCGIAACSSYPNMTFAENISR